MSIDTILPFVQRIPFQGGTEHGFVFGCPVALHDYMEWKGVFSTFVAATKSQIGLIEEVPVVATYDSISGSLVVNKFMIVINYSIVKF